MKNHLKIYLGLLVAIFLFTGCSSVEMSGDIESEPAAMEVVAEESAPAVDIVAEPAPMEAVVEASAPAVEIGEGLAPGLYAKIATSKGMITCKLEFEKTPLTVANFVGLAEGTIENDEKEAGVPYYDGLTFHRVLSNFMIQGGCPQGNGMGDPGYKFPDEFDATLTHAGPGILSMANSGPGTNGSQFFITHNKTPWLDGKHTVFGHVVEGQDVVNVIQQGDTMDRITIGRVGEKAQAFKSDQASFEALLKQHQSSQDKKELQAAEAMQKTIAQQFPKAEKTKSGLHYVITQEGTGPKPVSGAVVSVHYTGKLLDGTIFDSSVQRGIPIQFPVGAGHVIRGWDEGILLMKQGEKRTLIIPPQLGYGARQTGPIPANSWLIFDVELVDAGAE
jgi:peptidylprolyl isomerase